MAGDKVYFTEFKNDPAGCIEARQFLISIGKWSRDLERRDGWEIVSTANKEIKKHNEPQWEPYDDI